MFVRGLEGSLEIFEANGVLRIGEVFCQAVMVLYTAWTVYLHINAVLRTFQHGCFSYIPAEWESCSSGKFIYSKYVLYN